MLENPVLDASAIEMLEQYGPTEFVVKILEVWLETLPASVDKILEGVAQQDCVKIAFSAHSLKSSSGNIGLRQLQSLVGNLETLARRDDFAAVMDNFSSFEETVERAKSAVMQLIHQLENHK